MKKIYLLLVILTMFLFVGCDTNNNYQNTEEPHLYWKDIDCEVTKCEYKYWYASGSHFKAEVSVKSDEYGLTKSFTYEGMDAKNFENTKIGDKVTCTLNSWALDSTGEVVKREIDSIK